MRPHSKENVSSFLAMKLDIGVAGGWERREASLRQSGSAYGATGFWHA